MPSTARKISLRRRLKRSLSSRFRYYPLLKLLVLNPWFRAAFLGVSALAILLLMCLPKIWRTTPADFTPEVKISWLDMIQCWSLKRTALKQAEAGRFGEAAYSWQMAVAQNPGDLDALRGYLDNFAKVVRPEPKLMSATVNLIAWTVRLGQTNAADLDRVAAISEQHRWHDVAGHFLSGAGERLSPEARAAHAKALFVQGKFKEFEAEAGKLEGGSAGLRLYRLAHRFGWGAKEEAAAARDELVKAMESLEQGPEAARLLLIVAARQGEIALFERALERLALSNQATVNDHVARWVLLASAGRKEEAIRLAQAFTQAPQSSQEMLRLADIHVKLGLRDAAREVLEKFLPMFGSSPEPWRYYAAFLEAEQDWVQLRTLALKMRERAVLASSLWAYSYFIEGLADYRLRLHDAAAIAFAKASEAELDSPLTGLSLAQRMAALNFGAPALRILRQLEGRVEENAEFWETYFEAAYSARDEAAVLKAAEQSHKLKPQDAELHNRYAAALLLNRKDPGESIRMTRQLLGAFPNSTSALINHGYALMLNRRLGEARTVLESLATRSMGPGEANAYHLGSFELYFTLEMWDEALRHSAKVNRAPLFPSQLERFEIMRAELPERMASKAASAAKS
jgi:tetratricopeptide (TPR) repeat protein